MFEKSHILPEILECISLYSGKREHHYLADWIDYLHSLRHEDLFIQDVKRVWISTMHKSKGKEFNSVFLYLDNAPFRKAADYRLLYVALTRAEVNLHVYTNTNTFKPFINRDEDWIEHDDPHDELGRIDLQFGLGHINLGNVKRSSIQKGLKSIVAGGALPISKNVNTVIINDCHLRFSKKAIEEIATWEQKGYTLKHASVDRIVVWRDKDEQENNSYRVPIIRVRLFKTE